MYIFGEKYIHMYIQTWINPYIKEAYPVPEARPEIQSSLECTALPLKSSTIPFKGVLKLFISAFVQSHQKKYSVLVLHVQRKIKQETKILQISNNLTCSAI